MTEIFCQQQFLEPGFSAVSVKPTLLCSVSGSGIVITLWDRIKRIGAMAHCRYAAPKLGEELSNYYVSVILPYLLKNLKKHSVYLNNIEAQIFGAGSRTGQIDRRMQKAIKEVRRICRREKVQISSEDIGGYAGRKIMFNTFSGETIILKTGKIRSTDWIVY